MSARSKRRFMTPKTKKISFAIVILVTVALLVFAEVIRPNQDAAAYTNRLQTASTPLEECFVKLSDTTQQDIFYAPDIDIKVKQANVATIQKQLASCQTELNRFEATTHDLLALHLAGYTKTYRDAKVNQKHAQNVVGQCQDVMNQYSQMADWMKQYYDQVGAFLTTFKAMNDADNNFTLSNRNNQVTNQAVSLRANAAAIRALKAPTGLAAAQADTATMVENVATGFENLAKGLNTYSDTYKSLGYKQIDAAIASYDTKVISQPFEVFKDSYVLTQVKALPSKIENLLAVETE